MTAIYAIVACVIVLLCYTAGRIDGRRRSVVELEGVEDEPNMTVLSAKTGDTIVISYPGTLTKVQREDIRDQVDEAIPDGIKVIVLDCGATAALSERDRRYPIGSTQPVRWDDTQPLDQPTEHVQPTKPWRQE